MMVKEIIAYYFSCSSLISVSYFKTQSWYLYFNASSFQDIALLLDDRELNPMLLACMLGYAKSIFSLIYFMFGFLSKNEILGVK